MWVSDSTLVAPVRLGSGAYIAAGSVITNDVEADALAIGRGRQENKPDWAKRRRAAMPEHKKILNYKTSMGWYTLGSLSSPTEMSSPEDETAFTKGVSGRMLKGDVRKSRPWRICISVPAST